MTASTKMGLASLLHGVAWLFFVIGGFAFFVGGKAFGEFANTPWLLAEVEGIGLAMLCAAIGAIAQTAATHLEEGDTTISLTDSLRR